MTRYSKVQIWDLTTNTIDIFGFIQQKETCKNKGWKDAVLLRNEHFTLNLISIPRAQISWYTYIHTWTRACTHRHTHTHVCLHTNTSAQTHTRAHKHTCARAKWTKGQINWLCRSAAHPKYILILHPPFVLMFGCHLVYKSNLNGSFSESYVFLRQTYYAKRV